MSFCFFRKSCGGGEIITEINAFEILCQESRPMAKGGDDFNSKRVITEDDFHKSGKEKKLDT